MAEFTKEQLIVQAQKNIAVLRGAVEKIPGNSEAAVIHLRLAEIALAALTAGMEQEPVIIVGDDGGDALAYRRLIQNFAPGTKLYAAPQLPQPAVTDISRLEDVLEWINGLPVPTKSATANYCRLKNFITDYRAAMLQGGK